MTNTIKCLTAAALTMLAGGLTAATNAKGSNMKNPLTMSANSSMSVTLVNEYMPDFKENTDSGVCYIRVNLSKGSSYTVWLQGGSTPDLSFSVDPNYEDESAPMASFEYDYRDDGNVQIAYMYADSWSPEDPSSGTYYIWIMGEIGQTTRVSVSPGIRSFSQEGEEDNPRRLTMTESIQIDGRAQLGDGDFYYVMHLEAGRKYRIWAAGETASVAISTLQVGDLSPEGDTLYKAYFPSVFPGYSFTFADGTTNGVGYVVYPEITGDYIFDMWSRGAQNFKVLYQAFKKLPPEEHKNKVLLTEDMGYEAEVMPGRENSDGVYNYDAVIDETLCKINVSKGERWVFETEGANAATNIMMRIYDVGGNILRENATKGGGSADVRATMTASYDGAYYVGVCNPKLLFSDTPDADYKVKISARQAEEFDGPNDSDEFDPVDDAFTGASMIVPVPGDSSNSVVEACAPHGPHVLSGRDWYDWYCFAGRGGVTYRLKASWATEEKTDLGLRAQVYKMVNGVASGVTPRLGSLTPGSDTAALTFTADADAMYYVCVSTTEPVGDGFRDAPGLDFPAYNMHAVGYLDGYTFGLLTVDTYGADGTWTLDDLGRTGTMRYPSGATALVVANANAKVNYQPLDGYTPPAPQTVTPVAGANLSIHGRYVDAMEPKDNSVVLADILKGGYTGLAPSSAGATVKRTLWADDDPADAFLFVANAGVYYSFSLKDTTEKLTAGTKLAGDAVMTFYAYKDGALVPIAGLDGVTEVSKRLLDPGYIVVSVHHSAFPADTCYALEYFSANVGTISFASTNVSATKGDGYADVVLRRSASEGAVSVRYATVAGTAKPGEDYYPTTEEGVVRWEDGDMADKVIRVRLIPSLIDNWTEDRTLQVEIAPFSEDSIADDEYPAVLSGDDTATVTIASAVAKNPGTVSLLDQPLEVTAGDSTFNLRLERTGGNEGRIALAVSSSPGTAVAGTDYKNITYTVVEWADGEDGVKTVAFETFDKGSVAAKTVNIGMMPVTADYRAYGYGDYRDCLVPKVATPTAVLTIAGNVAKETGSLLRSAAAAGVGISTPIGSWYSDGTLRSGELAAGGSARIGFTVEGPGFLKVDPQVENGAGTASMIYLAGSGPVRDCTDHDGPMMLTLPAGRQTVLFQVNSPNGGAYASFSNVDNGLPFKWMPLSTVTAASPISGAVVPAYGGPLAWTAPAGWNKEEIWYRLRLGVSQASIPYQASTETLELESPINTPMIANYITNAVAKLGIGQNARFWWTVECAYSTDPTPDFAQLAWITVPGAWNFAIAGQGTPETNVSGFDAFGAAIVPGTPVELVQGVRFEADLSIGGGYSATLSGCVGGQLPPGLTASGLKISGVPSEPGSYTALVEVAVGPYFATTTMLEFNVAEAGTTLGAFGGTLVEDGSAAPNAWGRNLLLTTTVSGSGDISAAVNYFGGRLTFSSSSGYDEYDAKTGTSKVLLSTPVVSQGVTYFNTVEMSVRKEALDDALGMGQEMGSAKLTLWLADASGVLTERTYICGLSRSNGDSAVFAEAMKAFAGYYTVALAPVGPLVGEPSGNGLLTMTLATNGIARFAGILADGTSMSMTSYASLLGDLSDPMACELTVPVWSSAANYSFGGVLRVRPGAADEAGVATSWVVSTAELSWAKDGAGSTYDGAGFTLSLSPVGGWYDTVVNLQQYYLDKDFTVETEPVTGIPEYLRYPGLAYSVDSTPHGVSALLNGNVLSAVATSFVMEKEGSRRFDLAKSQNPWGVKLAFSRGNGLVSGTFNLIVDDKSSPQGYAATLNHRGLLLMNRDVKAPLDEDVWTAGFYLMPSSKGEWLISRPFNIRATAVDRDWSEVDLY